MKPRSRSSLALVSLLVAASLAFADAGPRAALAGSRWDFGKVRRGTRVETSVEISNPGSGDLLIAGMTMSMQGIVIKAPRSVAAGQTAKISLELNTASLEGEVRANVVLHTNDPANRELKLDIVGFVESLVELEPTPAIFLSAFRWEAQEKESSVLIVNKDQTPLKILDLQSEGISFTPRLAVIEEGQRFQLFAKLSSGAVPGKDLGRVTLLTDKETIQIPVYTFLKEKVYANPPYLDFGRIDLDQVTADPGLLDFRKVSVFLYQVHGDDFRIHVESNPDFLAIATTPAQGPGSVVEIPRQGRTAIFELEVSLLRERLKRGRFEDSIRISTNDSEFPAITIPIHLEVD